MDTSKKTTTAGRVQGGGTHRPHPNKPAEGAISETNTSTKRPKLATGFWPVEPQNDHLRKEGLQKTKKAMLNALTKEKDNENWDDSNSSNSGKGED